ncbi:MAG: hypothetical protein WAM97_04775 [Acidimicrobiales bacterium]
MPGIVLAWLAGESLIIYRSYKNDHRPPLPGQLLASSGVFAVLGFMAQNQNLTFLAGALAWGFDIAAFMNVAPAMLTGATATEKKATA